MLPVDVVRAAPDAQPVRLEQHVCVRGADRRLEAVRGQLDEQPERVLEVDGVHEAAVLRAAVLNAALVEPLDHLPERRLRDVERGDYNIDQAHLADAIEALAAQSRSLSDDRSPKNPYR